MRTLSVDALSEELKALFARHFPTVAVEGEVGQLTVASSGHAYFTLRGRETVLNSVMWRGEWAGSTFKPKVGDQVVARGRIGVFGPQGRYQLYATSIQPAGEGKLAKELAARVARLEAEGLLDPRRKRALPKAPRVVGIVTSPTGAALQDVLRISRHRFPAARLLLAPCVVQGQEAPMSIVQAIELLVEQGEAEVIVITRGGGAKEDMLAFWDEGLARYVSTLPVPVVSAIGHEVDTCLVDMVADAVAPTPSGAMILVLPDGPALSQRVDLAAMALRQAARGQVGLKADRVDGLRRRLRHPGELLVRSRVRNDELRLRLSAAMLRRVRERAVQVDGAEQRVNRAISAVLRTKLARLERAEASLRALSPVGVLQRGYAIVQGPNGVLLDPAGAPVGTELSVRLAKGSLVARVIEG